MHKYKDARLDLAGKHIYQKQTETIWLWNISLNPFASLVES